MNVRGRVGFIGTHSTGKTTVAKKLHHCPETMHLRMVGGHARRVLRAGGQLNERATMESQLSIMMGLCADVMKYSDIVSDRSPLDVLAYTDASTEVDPTHISYHHMHSLAWQTLQMYDYLFYFPIVLSVAEDGVRSSDERFRLLIDNILLEQIDRSPVPIIKLDSDDIDGLYKQVKKYLGVKR